MNMNKINIDGFEVGGDKTYVIAEIGSNHNQSFDLALESVDAAKESGANAVKFQSLNVDKLYLNPSDSIKELHKRIDLQEEWHQKLNDYCIKKEITFHSTPTYMESIDILEQLNVKLYKLASAQIGTFPQLVNKVASLGKPTIFSTGLTSLSDLDQVVDIFEKNNNPNYIILHCNSIYPAPYDKINLKLIETYQKRYGKIIGFSDHSDGIATAIAAVSLGAKVIEKHFAIDRKLPVPDAPFSLEPDEFKDLVEGIRIAELAVNERDRNEIEKEESAFKQQILYRLVSKNRIEKGSTLKQEDLQYLRNPNGIDCRFEADYLGRNLKETVKSNTLITEDLLH